MSTPALSRQRVVDRSLHGPALARPPEAHRCPGATAASGGLAGRYRYDRRNGDWWWSPEMFELYGLPPGSPQPDTEVYLGYQHPEDRTRVLEAISGACATGGSFALETRIVRSDGRGRDVVLVGETRLDPCGSVLAVEGMAIDITECRPPGSDVERVHALQAEVEQMRAAMASRAAIEQAKGILMLLTSCSDQVAFDLLAHISSHTHRKVRDVAQVITASAAGTTPLPDDIRGIIRDACPPSQPLR
jgi:hypothetical protein